MLPRLHELDAYNLQGAVGWFYNYFPGRYLGV